MNYSMRRVFHRIRYRGFRFIFSLRYRGFRLSFRRCVRTCFRPRFLLTYLGFRIISRRRFRLCFRWCFRRCFRRSFGDRYQYWVVSMRAESFGGVWMGVERGISGRVGDTPRENTCDSGRLLVAERGALLRAGLTGD